MRRSEILTKEVKDIARLMNYRRKTVSLVVTERFTLTDLNWSGGTRSIYTAIAIGHNATFTPRLDHNPPWSNMYEGMTVDLPENIIVARTGLFCGKTSQMTLFVHPNNMPNLLPP
jgi:hypothetical protein